MKTNKLFLLLLVSGSSLYALEQRDIKPMDVARGGESSDSEEEDKFLAAELGGISAQCEAERDRREEEAAREYSLDAERDDVVAELGLHLSRCSVAPPESRASEESRHSALRHSSQGRASTAFGEHVTAVYKHKKQKSKQLHEAARARIAAEQAQALAAGIPLPVPPAPKERGEKRLRTRTPDFTDKVELSSPKGSPQRPKVRPLTAQPARKRFCTKDGQAIPRRNFSDAMEE